MQASGVRVVSTARTYPRLLARRNSGSVRLGMQLTEATGGRIVVIMMRALGPRGSRWGRVKLREKFDVAEFS
jgi:hypothetical protein